MYDFSAEIVALKTTGCWYKYGYWQETGKIFTFSYHFAA
jgi:hypothetical protein